MPNSSLPRTVDALLIIGNNSSQRQTELTQPTRISLLAAGLLHNAGFSDKIVLLSVFPQLVLMKNYLLDIFPNIKEEDIISEEKMDDSHSAKDIKRVIGKYPELKELGIISTGEVPKQSFFDKVGLSITSISPEEVLDERRIARSLRKSRHVVTELIKETVLNFIRYRRMLENIHLHKVSLL